MAYSALDVISDVAAPLTGKRVLDIGCGGGQLAAALVEQGCVVAGVEPGAEALATARALVPGAEFHQSGAERLPFAAGRFDVAVMVNALHHVPVASMAAALQEAGRVLKPDGLLMVFEPAAEGNFFEALRPIEDETQVRHAAQDALEQAITSGVWRRLRGFRYDRMEWFANVDGFVARVVAVDPARRAVVASRRKEITDAFERNAVRVGDGRLQLVQPIIVQVLSPRG